jgi:hypothetical protein
VTPKLTAGPLSRVGAGPGCYLWEPYLPRGRVVVLDGDPGIGKSMLTLDLAARLSRGGELPDGQRAARPFVTLLLNADDGGSDVVRPRAEGAAADLDRLFVVTAEDEQPTFPDDVADLEEAIAGCRAELVVIDPLVAFLPPEGNANGDGCVRAAVGPLAAAAARTRCTIVLVRHLPKVVAGYPRQPGFGRVRLNGVVRAGLLVEWHPTDPGLRVLAGTKPEPARKAPVLGFRIVRAAATGFPRIEWTGPVAESAEALGLPVGAPLAPRDAAADWLLRQLADGPRPAAELYAAAAAANIPARTLERAKADTGVRSFQSTTPAGARAWYWFDPVAPWPPNAPFPRTGEVPPVPGSY